MSTYTTVTTYTAVCQEIFSPNLFHNSFDGAPENATEATKRDQFTHACFERYSNNLNKALKPYQATILGNGEVIANIQAEKQLTRELFREIVQNVDENTDYEDIMVQYEI